MEIWNKPKKANGKNGAKKCQHEKITYEIQYSQ